MSIRKELFINSIKLVEVEDRTNIPTSITYESDSPYIGYEAFGRDGMGQLIENFKLELGNQDPTISSKNRVQIGKHQSKSVHELTKDFFETAIKKAEDWINDRGFKRATRIIVAEPIAMGEKESVKSSWLNYYRAHIKRILEHKFDHVDFLPEPFAVFQYYRYGIKHNLVTQKQKHVALVIDFGGGTFDVSVIETTNAGDVSAGGRNSRPLAAASSPVGGFYINRVIAESLLFKAVSKPFNGGDYQIALKKFTEIEASGGESLTSYREDHQNFYKHFKALLREVEKAKILICNQIQNWDLEFDLRSNNPMFPIKVPNNALKENADYASIKLDAYDLKELFEKKIWNQKLKPTISDSLARAQVELNGQPISIVLMSGGSSNIRWLSGLIRSELNHRLRDAEVLELQENFQEIVAKGLAVECARRTFSDVGDFQSVTYNRLSLSLEPDNGGVEIKRYKPQLSGLPSEAEEGVLLPSASVLGKLINQPIRWKVKLSRPPKQKLDYYFMRSSFDHEDLDNIFNIDHTVHTKPGTRFDSNIQVELTVREDGTATPKFIYQEPLHFVTGKPFYMDMTLATDAGVGEAYIGFDFGSSNSSISYIERSSIAVYQDRSKNLGWVQLNDLVDMLPYPVAAPLAKYIAGSTSAHKEMLALDAIEAFIAFAAFISYQEFCSLRNEKATDRVFKTFTQRSAGPLWRLLRDSQAAMGSRAVITSEFNELLQGQNYSQLNLMVTNIANFKHGKLSDPLDYFNVLTILGNITNRVMANKLFGSFEAVKRKSFSKKDFIGQFREAKGKNPPFINLYNYIGSETFSEEQVFIVDTISSCALNLSPIYFWAQPLNSPRPESSALFVYDIQKDGVFEFKATELSKPLIVTSEDTYSEMHEYLNNMRNADIKLSLINGINIFKDDASD